MGLEQRLMSNLHFSSLLMLSCSVALAPEEGQMASGSDVSTADFGHQTQRPAVNQRSWCLDVMSGATGA